MVVVVICAIAPARERGWMGGLLIWAGMSWASVVDDFGYDMPGQRQKKG